MSNYQHALQTAIEAAREAGAILRNDLHRPDGPRGGGSHADGRCVSRRTDLRDTSGDQSLIDALNRDFGNLREVLGQTASREFHQDLLEPVLAKFSETLACVAQGHSSLEAKCDDLITQLARFLALELRIDDSGLGGGPWPSRDDEPDLGDVPF